MYTQPRQQIHSPQQKSQTRQQQPPKQRCSDQTPKEKRIAQTTDERKKRGPEFVLKGRYLYRTLYPPVKKTLKGQCALLTPVLQRRTCYAGRKATGRFLITKTIPVEISIGTPSTRFRSFNCSSIIGKTTFASSRARGAPTQKWMP